MENKFTFSRGMFFIAFLSQLALTVGFFGNPYLIKHVGIVILKSWTLKIAVIPVLFILLARFKQTTWFRGKLSEAGNFIRGSIAPVLVYVIVFIQSGLWFQIATLEHIQDAYLFGVASVFNGKVFDRTNIVFLYSLLSVFLSLLLLSALAYLIQKTKKTDSK